MLIEVSDLDLAMKAEYIDAMNEYKNNNKDKIKLNRITHPLAVDDKFCWDNVNVDRQRDDREVEFVEYVCVKNKQIIGCFYYLIYTTGSEVTGCEFFALNLRDPNYTFGKDMYDLFKQYMNKCDIIIHDELSTDRYNTVDHAVVNTEKFMCLDGMEREFSYVSIKDVGTEYKEPNEVVLEVGTLYQER